MAETFNIGTTARLDGKNTKKSAFPAITPADGLLPAQPILPDSVCWSAQAIQTAARNGGTFLCTMPDGGLRWCSIDAGQGGPGGETVLRRGRAVGA